MKGLIGLVVEARRDRDPRAYVGRSPLTTSVSDAATQSRYVENPRGHWFAIRWSRIANRALSPQEASSAAS